MGNSCVTVLNHTPRPLCVLCFGGLDALPLPLLADHLEQLFVVAPGQSCDLQATTSTSGLQVAIIWDVHPTEHYYSYDLWWVKAGATLTVSAVDPLRRVVDAHGGDCESYGRDKRLYDAKRATNLRMCLNLFKQNYTEICHPPVPTTGPLCHFATAPYLLIDNSLSTTSVKIMDFLESCLPLSSDSSASIEDISAPYSFHIFAPGTVTAYAYVKLPRNTQIILPDDWTLPKDFNKILALKHLRLHNTNRYTLLMDPCAGKSTVIVTSSMGSQYMKIIPVGGMRENHVQRLVLVLNVLLSCFDPDSDPYLVGNLVPVAGQPQTSGERMGSFSQPPEIVSDLPGWFNFCDVTSRGSVTQEEIVQGLIKSFGKDLDESSLGRMRESVASIWSQVFGNAIDYGASDFPAKFLEPHEAINKMRISLEVFMEEDGVGMTLKEYFVPIYQSLDHLFSMIKSAATVTERVDEGGRIILALPSGCAITRQHILDILLGQHGDVKDAELILQQMHPSLTGVLNMELSAPSAPPQFLPLPATRSDIEPSVNFAWPSPAEYSTFNHPAVRVCALASRDIYYCASGTCDGSEDIPHEIPAYEKIQWQHLSSGDVDVRRNEMTRWALWREVLPNSDSGLEPITVLVFRGTSLDKSFQDVLHDAMIQPLKLNLHINRPQSQPADTSVCPHVYVHAGFYTAIENIFETILQALKSNNVQSFYVSGHSLGGALAQMFGLKYLVCQPLVQGIHPAKDNCFVTNLCHILTFAAPMILWYGDDISAASTSLLQPWRQKCLNYMYRADPVPLLPRMLSCKFCWNALVASATTQTHWIGSFLAQKYISVPEEGEIPSDSVFRTLKFTRGFVPPGLTAVLLGAGSRVGSQGEWASSVLLPPESVQKLATSFDTFVRPEDGFELHSMGNYIRCCRDNAAYMDPGSEWVPVASDQE